MLYDLLMAKHQDGRYKSAMSVQNENMLEDLKAIAFTAVKNRDLPLIQMLGYCESDLKRFFTELEKNGDFDDGYEIDFRARMYSLNLVKIIGCKSIEHEGDKAIIDYELAVLIKQSFRLLENPYRRALHLMVENDNFDYSTLHDIYLDPAKGELSDYDIILPYIMGAPLRKSPGYGFMCESNYPVEWRTNPFASALHQINGLYENPLTAFRDDEKAYFASHPYELAIRTASPDYFSVMSLMSQMPEDVSAFYIDMAQTLANGTVEYELDPQYVTFIDKIKAARDLPDLKRVIASEYQKIEVPIFNESAKCKNLLPWIISQVELCSKVDDTINKLSLNATLHNVDTDAEAILDIFLQLSIEAISNLHLFPHANLTCASELIKRFAANKDFDINIIRKIGMNCPVSVAHDALKFEQFGRDTCQTIMSYFGKFQGKNIAFNGVILDKAAQMLADCELRFPGFLKDIDFKLMEFQKSELQQQFMVKVMQIVNDEKIKVSDMSNLAPEVEADMSFMNSGLAL
jgi:hypothetical protein